MGFDDRLALASGAVGKDVGEVGADTFDGFGVGRFRRVVGELAEFVAAGGELVELDGRVADAVAAGSLVEGAVLERAQVAVDGRLGGADLAADGVELGGVLVAAFGT